MHQSEAHGPASPLSLSSIRHLLTRMMPILDAADVAEEVKNKAIERFVKTLAALCEVRILPDNLDKTLLAVKRVVANLTLGEASITEGNGSSIPEEQMEFLLNLSLPDSIVVGAVSTSLAVMNKSKRRRSCDRSNADSDEEDGSRENEKISKAVGDTGSSSNKRAMVKKEEKKAGGSVLGKECTRLLAGKGFCIAPFMHDGVSDAVNQLLGEGGPADIFFSMDSATALCAAEDVKEEEEEEDQKKKGGLNRRGFWQAGPRRSVMRMVIGQELPGAKALQPNDPEGYKAAAARAVAQQMQATIQRAGEAMRGMAEGALREIAQEVGGEDVMHLVETYGKGGSNVQAILTVSMISGEVEEEEESVADCGVHTDRGLLTLMCSREGKGLSVRGHENSNTAWTDDAEQKDMVTVLGGHVLERVSLGRAKAAEHAVFSRGGGRLSVALTLRPAGGQSVRVNGAVVAAEDVMGELVGSVNEPESEEERHSQEKDPGGDGYEESGGSEASEGKVAFEYDTIEIKFRAGSFSRTFTNVRRGTKLETLSRPFCRMLGGDKPGGWMFRRGHDGQRLGPHFEMGSHFDFSEREHQIDVFQEQSGD